ncbi:MAG TPA: iron-sulfur cluster assembly accessory protein [Gemmatimonadota bacterium]|nr:iron-sulfur cluster assembly accessory protein [Gemmatimonadota bacterium]
MDATTRTEQQDEGLGIRLSELAVEKVRDFMTEEGMEVGAAGLRLSVVPGGCSGFEYSMNLESSAREDDFVLDEHGVRVFVDPFSAQYLEGVSIDYKSTFQGSGFTFDNPNATGGCGCGSSFAV